MNQLSGGLSEAEDTLHKIVRHRIDIGKYQTMFFFGFHRQDLHIVTQKIAKVENNNLRRGLFRFWDVKGVIDNCEPAIPKAVDSTHHLSSLK